MYWRKRNNIQRYHEKYHRQDYQHGLIYDKLISKFGIEPAKQYLTANKTVLQAYRDLCRNIDCGFEEKPAYAYSLGDRRKIEWELNVWKNWAFRLNLWTSSLFPFPLSARSDPLSRHRSTR